MEVDVNGSGVLPRAVGVLVSLVAAASGDAWSFILLGAGKKGN